MDRDIFAGIGDVSYDTVFLTAIAQRSLQLDHDINDNDMAYLADILAWYNKYDLKDVSPGIGFEMANNNDLDDKFAMELFYGVGNLALVKAAYNDDRGLLSIADTCFLEAQKLSAELRNNNLHEHVTRVRANLETYATTLFLTLNPHPMITDDYGFA
ncbi:hypothetical protein HQ533_01095 [Candidatus Woesearchaeota archaeon]|nr:hypothetical protein [Candidatus Woesearchaeota archaeon]